MCNFRSGEAVLTSAGLKIYWSKTTDSHTAIRKEFGIAEVMDLIREPGHIPIELIPTRGLLQKRDYDLVFDAGKPSWWRPEYDQQAIDEMWEAVTEWLDIPTRTIRCPTDLRLDRLTKLPMGMIIASVGGNLWLKSLTSLDADVKLPDSVGGSLWLDSLTSLDADVKLPNSVGGSLWLNSLTSLDDIPQKLRQKVRQWLT